MPLTGSAGRSDATTSPRCRLLEPHDHKGPTSGDEAILANQVRTRRFLDADPYPCIGDHIALAARQRKNRIEIELGNFGNGLREP